jgi:hypothetical protein
MGINRLWPVKAEANSRLVKVSTMTVVAQMMSQKKYMSLSMFGPLRQNFWHALLYSRFKRIHTEKWSSYLIFLCVTRYMINYLRATTLNYITQFARQMNWGGVLIDGITHFLMPVLQCFPTADTISYKWRPVVFSRNANWQTVVSHQYTWNKR